MLGALTAAFRLGQGPKRIVCLTEEPTEILYLLGESHRVVGISAYTVRPPEARRDKPVVSAFVGGSVKKICALRPDLVIGFSDIQAELASKLIAANLQVVIFNQRSVQQILDVIVDIGSLVNARERAERLVTGYIDRIEKAMQRAAARAHRPKVYFEEWDDPMICGIQWVSELIEIAGGIDVFADRACGKGARERTVTVEDVVQANPDVVLASWCGKPFDRRAFEDRPGMANVAAVRAHRVHEIAPEIILQPGPASLTDGLACLQKLLHGSTASS